MSRARRIAHRHLVYSQKNQRALGRRNHECRVRHWRQMLAGMTVNEWRRPMDQWLRVAYVSVRCREHRSNAWVPAVIRGVEEDAARNPRDLESLKELKIRNAKMTAHKMLVPRRYRREFA